jgi:hypothetical protein
VPEAQPSLQDLLLQVKDLRDREARKALERAEDLVLMMQKIPKKPVQIDWGS